MLDYPQMQYSPVLSTYSELQANESVFDGPFPESWLDVAAGLGCNVLVECHCPIEHRPVRHHTP
jgi:hypothetical protein